MDYLGKILSYGFKMFWIFWALGEIDKLIKHLRYWIGKHIGGRINILLNG